MQNAQSSANPGGGAGHGREVTGCGLSSDIGRFVLPFISTAELIAVPMHRPTARHAWRAHYPVRCVIGAAIRNAMPSGCQR